MNELKLIENDPSRQLLLPGIRPYFTKFFRMPCFETGAHDDNPCERPAALLMFKGLYLPMAIEKCIADIFDKSYACSSAHLESMLRRRIERGVQPEEIKPDLIVNAHGGIEREIYARVLWNGLGQQVPETYFSDERYTLHNCSFEEHWKREKHHFGF